MKQSDLESNNNIPYKYIDADNKIYKDVNLNNNDESSIDISGKISNDISKIDPKKLSEDELCKLIEDKDKILIELNQKRETLKTELATNIYKLNEVITENAELLYKKSPSPSEIKWLTEQYNAKKKTLDIERKINHSYKVQYNILENKMKTRNSNLNSKNNTNGDNDMNSKSLKISNKSTKVSSNLYMNVEDQINKVKNENKDMVLKITNIKNRKAAQKREMDSILNGEKNSQLEQKCEELNKLKSLKYEAEEKFSTSNRALEMMNKKVDNFEQKIKKIDTDEYDDDNYSLNICNFWLSLCKEELENKNPDELVELIRNEKSKFMNELNKKKVVVKKKKKKKILQDGGTDMTANNTNGMSDQNNNITNRDNNNNNKSKKQIKNINKNKNIFAIFSILNTSININNDSKLNNNMKNDNDKLLKLKEDINILNDLTDIEYRQLLNKKEEYLETNMRLDKNLKDFSKTEQTKLSKVAKSIKEKDFQLKITKEKNELIQDEVNNLENIYQLSLEKEKINKEIIQKMNINTSKSNNIQNNNIKDEINNSVVTNNNNINQDIKTKMEDNNNNKGDSLYKLNMKKNNKEIILDNGDKNNFPETREEQLKLIKKKYLDDEEQEQKNNNIEEINSEQFIDSENKLNEMENKDQEQINNEYNYNKIEINNNYEDENDIDIINSNISNNNNINDEKIGEIENKNIKVKKAPFKV